MDTIRANEVERFVVDDRDDSAQLSGGEASGSNPTYTKRLHIPSEAVGAG